MQNELSEYIKENGITEFNLVEFNLEEFNRVRMCFQEALSQLAEEDPFDNFKLDFQTNTHTQQLPWLACFYEVNDMLINNFRVQLIPVYEDSGFLEIPFLIPFSAYASDFYAFVDLSDPEEPELLGLISQQTAIKRGQTYSVNPAYLQLPSSELWPSSAFYYHLLNYPQSEVTAFQFAEEPMAEDWLAESLMEDEEDMRARESLWDLKDFEIDMQFAIMQSEYFSLKWHKLIDELFLEFQEDQLIPVLAQAAKLIWVQQSRQTPRLWAGPAQENTFLDLPEIEIFVLGNENLQQEIRQGTKEFNPLDINEHGHLVGVIRPIPSDWVIRYVLGFSKELFKSASDSSISPEIQDAWFTAKLHEPDSYKILLAENLKSQLSRISLDLDVGQHLGQIAGIAIFIAKQE